MGIIILEFRYVNYVMFLLYVNIKGEIIFVIRRLILFEWNLYILIMYRWEGMDEKV